MYKKKEEAVYLWPLVIGILLIFIILIVLCTGKIENTLAEPKYYEHTAYGHMIKELDGIEYAKNNLPIVGNFDEFLGGEIIRVNIVGEKKGSVRYWNVASIPKKVDEGSEGLTYVYYSYTVNTLASN